MSKRMIQMLAVLLAVVGVLAFIKFQQIQAAISGGKGYAPPPETVTTVVAKTENWPGTLEAVGSAEPVQGVTLSADLAGVIDRIEFSSGAYVRSGQVLVSLDARQEKAQLAAAEAQRDLAKTNLDRARTLLDQKAIAQAEFDRSRHSPSRPRHRSWVTKRRLGARRFALPFRDAPGFAWSISAST